ncbi:MAG TPA: potassium-transporting ATPase subunit KdpC [Polyangia bacterium]
MKPSVVLVALRFTVVTLLLCGVAYPLLATALAQLVFPSRADGSIVTDDRGRVVGSELIGQSFAKPYYFWSRPSAAGDKGWDATSSAGSNLSVTSKKLHQRVDGERARLAKENPDAEGPPPDDLLTASASGLDPDISPAAARWQVPRVAKARGVTAERVRQLVDANVDGRELGFLGEPRVNVLTLNLALDQQFGAALSR